MKYKVGQPLICYRYDEGVAIPVLGCIVETFKDVKTTIYYVDWSDDEDDCYTEQMIDIYIKNMESCVSGLNEQFAKLSIPKGSVGSNPTLSANLYLIQK